MYLFLIQILLLLPMKQALFFLVILSSFVANAQGNLHCGSDEQFVQFYMEHPELKGAYLRAKEKLDVFTQVYKQNHVKSGATYVIPVVFHIIHNNGVENINDSQIHDAIKQVNLQLRKLNPDTNQIVPAFQSIATDTEIEIRLAQLDPNGNCTTGITRTVSSLTNPGNHDVKSLIHWPSDKYLNIYICADAAGLAGHALMPAQADTIPNWDGIVIRHDYVGTIGTSDYFRRTVLTHEIGHYLNLFHIWGGNNVPNFYYLPVGDAGNCAFDDDVTDTPNTIGWSTCNVNATSCSSLDNVQNYMDYAYCALMFTEEQKLRMHAALNSSVSNRNNLWTAANRLATGTNDIVNQLCVANLESDRRLVCVGDTVNLLDISVHGVTNRLWTVNGASYQSSLTNENVQVVFSAPGKYSVGIKVFSGTDSLELNLTDYITVLPNVGGTSGLSDGFECSQNNFEQNWNKVPLSQPVNWEVANSGFQSSKSIYLDNYNGGSGPTYEFISNPLNLQGYSSLAVAYDWAYVQRTLNDADLFRILVSNNCGETWQVKRSYSGLGSLKTAPTNDSTAFIPQSQAEWLSDTLVINGSANFSNQTQFKFQFTAKGGNNFYLDNIRIGNLNALGISNLSLTNGVKIYPNPIGNSSFVVIETETLMTSITILDAQGRVVQQEVFQETTNKAIDVSKLAVGMYTFVLETKNGFVQEKVVVNK